MNNKIYHYADGPKYCKCHIIEKGSYFSCLKGFECCANFDRIVRENGLEDLNKKLVQSKF